MDKERICNLCALPCSLNEYQTSNPKDKALIEGGLLETVVSGGYYSTPGNGSGALDDMVGYKFSLCEFCLDWLFAQFKVPVEIEDASIVNIFEINPLDLARPAPQRVIEDDWRSNKSQFFEQASIRAKARGKEYKELERYKKLLTFK